MLAIEANEWLLGYKYAILAWLLVVLIISELHASC